jgi:hypothetical protein
LSGGPAPRPPCGRLFVVSGSFFISDEIGEENEADHLMEKGEN